MDIALKILLCAAAYLVGSINFAIVFSRAKGRNIKEHGSGNPGTMNVLRTVGRIWGALTFVCDCGKGVIFALIGRFALHSYDWLFVLGLVTVIGHVFPIYSRFRGGKGVATSIGVYLAAYPVAAGITFVLLVLMLLFVKYGFIGSLLAETALAVYSCAVSVTDVCVIVCSVVMWLIVAFAHRGNVKRLIQGTENTLDLVGRETPSADGQEDKDDTGQGEQR